ncbi:GNAT family N-acetyltransferase [Paenibacillus sp. P26]|nr:GNAT family N-acetyltransferase [Paenibacillus sp. P26]
MFDSPQTLRESEEAFFGYFTEEGKLAGAVSCKQGAKELTICRMMVHPDYFRRGIAGRLLEYAEQFAVPGMRIKVSTGTNNTPAVQLYTKYGYEPVQRQLVAPGVTLTQFQKMKPPPKRKGSGLKRNHPSERHARSLLLEDCRCRQARHPATPSAECPRFGSYTVPSMSRSRFRL